MFKRQRVRDPLHSIVEFDATEFEDVLWCVIQTRPFQRLRRIKQLGFSDLVYPGATHSRFAHSVGVFHTARQLMSVIERHLGNQVSEAHVHVALAASLVHDVGHGPFSHAFETVGRRFDLKMAKHENVSDALIRNSEIAGVLKRLGSGFANDVADVVRNAGPGNIYSAVVSSQFDADRLDYMRRDRLMTGTQHSAIDFDWLIANMEVGSVPQGVDDTALAPVETFVLGPKALPAAEAYVLGLFQLYPTVYFHKATRSAERIFAELLSLAITTIREGSPALVGLANNHPLVRFASSPDDIERVLALDDSVVWGALSMMAEGEHKIVAEFAKRLRDRKLFKSIDIRREILLALNPTEASESALEKVFRTINTIVSEWERLNSQRQSRILFDEATREPYKQMQESKGPLNQIRIKTEANEFVDLGEQSKIVKAIEPFRMFRAYIADGDTEARAIIGDAIKTGVADVRRS